jgi:tetratricopeptide (TPR) repeat protein
MAGRYLEFLISCLIQLKQDSDAANLMLEKAIKLIPITEKLAFQQFRAARSIMSQIGTSTETAEFDKSFGSALLRHGKTDQGMEFLADTKQKASIDSLSLADTYLTSAQDRFSKNDYDTYFTLVDQALSIYADLEMLQEASSIALAEARKLWSVDNIAYSMIFLERAWEPLSRAFMTEVTLSIQPITQVILGFINELFSQKRFDEALGFIELLERIYKHFNRTDKILEIERKKVEAFIGRGNYEGAISKVYDVVNLGLDDFKINEVALLIHDFLPHFIQYAAENSKDLLKLYFKLLIGSTSPNSSLIRETAEKYLNLVFDTLNRNEKDLFHLQLTLVINAILEIREASTQAIHIVMNAINKFLELSLFNEIRELLNRHQPVFNSLLPEFKLELIKRLNLVITSRNFPDEDILAIIPWIGNFSKSLNDEQKDTAAIILFNIGNYYKKKKLLKNSAHKEALKVSQAINSTITTFKLLEAQFRNDFNSGEYIKALEILDEVIATLSNQTVPKEIAINFIDLLNELLPDLGRRKKKKWLDLFTEKYQLISTKFLGEQNIVSTADEQYSEQLLDEMLDFTSRKDKK